MATGESESSWTEYSPGPYVLNFDVLASLTVQLRNEPPAVSQTLLAVVDRLRPKNPPDSGWRSLTVDTADGRHVIEGDGFCRNLLEILFEVHAKGGNALFSTWFYYDRDNTLSGHSPHSAHCFFVVDQDHIILPRAVLFGFPGFDKDFRPDVLISMKEQNRNPIWTSQVHEPTALSRVWYPRFYTQTIEGQLMVASDRRLFFFARPPQADVDIGKTEARNDHRELLGRLDRIGYLLTWLTLASVISAIALLVRLFR